MAVTYCTHCGKPAESGARFCMGCGCAMVNPMGEQGDNSSAYSGAAAGGGANAAPVNNQNAGYTQAVGTGSVTVYGITQSFLLGGAVKLYIDGQYVATVKKHDKVTLPITRDCWLRGKCGINFADANILIRAGRHTNVKASYDRIIGAVELKIM